jgi:cell division septation protein DedD
MTLQDYISQLLQHHSCVIVPDFGGFVANYKSAVVETHRNKIHPPSKSILFNPLLVNNDGLLGNYVAQNQEIQYPAALDFINSEVANWRNELNEGQRIELGEIGFLYQENDKIHFEQSREVNLLLQAYGLKSIDFVDFSLKKAAEPKVVSRVAPTVVKKEVVEIPVVKQEAVIEKEEVEAIEIVQEDTTVVKSNERKPDVLPIANDKTIIPLNAENKISDQKVIPIKRRRYLTVMKYAAAVAFVPVLFYSYWIPMETDFLDTGEIQFADFNPINTQVEKEYKFNTERLTSVENEKTESWEDLTESMSANSDIYNFELTEDFYIPVQLEVDKTDVVQNEIVEDVQEVESYSNANYQVISGCFSIKSNANNQIKELNSKGYSAAIFDVKGGLHRVTAGGFDNRDDAQSALDKLRNSGESGWILKN